MLDKILNKLPSIAILDAVDDNIKSGKRPCPMNTLTIEEVRQLRTHLEAQQASKLPTYEQALNEETGRALIALARGERWQSIIAAVWHGAIMWQKAIMEERKTKQKKKS